MGEISDKSQPENNLPQPPLEHTTPHQPIKNNERVIYDTELENTLNNLNEKYWSF